MQTHWLFTEPHPLLTPEQILERAFEAKKKAENFIYARAQHQYPQPKSTQPQAPRHVEPLLMSSSAPLTTSPAIGKRPRADEEARCRIKFQISGGPAGLPSVLVQDFPASAVFGDIMAYLYETLALTKGRGQGLALVGIRDVSTRRIIYPATPDVVRVFEGNGGRGCIASLNLNSNTVLAVRVHTQQNDGCA